MIKRKIFIATALLATMCMVGGCATSKSGEKAAEATTEVAATTEQTTPVELNASEYVKLGQYEGLTIKGSSTKVTEQEIEDKIDELAEEYTAYKEITSRDTVQKGDYLNIDYATTIDGKENEDYSDSSIDIHLGEGNLNVDDDVDIDEKLVGSKVGQEVEVEFTFPESYEDTSVAGKKCQMIVTINAIEKEVVPEITDSFIKKNTDCSTLKEYKQQVRKDLISDKKTEAQQNNEDALWTKIMENVTQIKEFPEYAVKQEVKNVKIENKEMAEYFGMSISDFIEQYNDMSIEEYAKDSLKRQCVQDLLVEAKNVTVTDEELNKEIQYYIDELGYKDKKDVLDTMPEEEIRSELLYTNLGIENAYCIFICSNITFCSYRFLIFWLC